MCWDRHCCTALWSTTAQWRSSFGEKKDRGRLPFKHSKSFHKDSEDHLPQKLLRQIITVKKTLLSSSLLMSPSFMSSCNFLFSNVGVNTGCSSTVPVHPGDPDWHLTPRTASKGEREMGRATGVHADHSLPSTTASIRRHVPRGSAGALSQRNELTDTDGEKKSTKRGSRNRPGLWCSNSHVNCDSSESHCSDAFPLLPLHLLLYTLEG